jgi:hypothetical protein
MVIDQLHDGSASCIDLVVLAGVGVADLNVNTTIEVEIRIRTTPTRDVPIRADTCPT